MVMIKDGDKVKILEFYKPSYILILNLRTKEKGIWELGGDIPNPHWMKKGIIVTFDLNTYGNGGRVKYKDRVLEFK